MAWQWTLEAAFFLGAALAQCLLAGLLIARHNRQEWVWALAVLFAFNGAVAFIRGLMAAAPHPPPDLCSTSPCPYVPGYEELWFVQSHFGHAMWLWLEPATSYLLAYLFLVYPERPAWALRHPWALRLLVLGPLAAHWALVVFARGLVFTPDPSGWQAWVLLIDRHAPAAAAWCIVLLRGAWVLRRIPSPVQHNQASIVVAAFGMRAAHVSLVVLLLHGATLGFGWTGTAVVAAELLLKALPVAALALAVAWLALARGPPFASRNAAFVLGALALGAATAFLFGVGSLLPKVGWGQLLTHLDLYVVRPALVWVGVVRHRYVRLSGGAWGLPAAGAFTALGVFAAVDPAFAGAVGSAVHRHALAAFAAAAVLLLAAVLARSPTFRPLAGAAGRDGHRLDSYVAAMEEAWRHGPPGPERERRLHRLRQRLGLPAGHGEALARAIQAGWQGPAPEGRRDWQPGDLLLGRYEVLGFLGEGGHGETHHAQDLLDGRHVVLKRTRRLDAASRRVLVAEAAAMERVASPRAVRLLRVEALGDEPVLVLEHMPGGSLQDLLARDGPVRGRPSLTMALHLLEALEDVHRAGLVHGDLKPSNVLLDGDGRLRLADFGQAQPLAGPDLLDSTRPAGGPAGSLRYMAPEQVHGLPPDERSDLYSAAVLLCEAVAGVHPLAAHTSDFALRSAIVAGRARPPAGLPEPLRTLLARALHPDPARRPASAAEMAAVLRQSGAPPSRNSKRVRPTPTTSPPTRGRRLPFGKGSQLTDVPLRDEATSSTAKPLPSATMREFSSETKGS